jgi:hypothetical protein
VPDPKLSLRLLLQCLGDAVSVALFRVKLVTGQRYTFTGGDPVAYGRKRLALMRQVVTFVSREQCVVVRMGTQVAALVGRYSELR